MNLWEHTTIKTTPSYRGARVATSMMSSARYKYCSLSEVHYAISIKGSEVSRVGRPSWVSALCPTPALFSFFCLFCFSLFFFVSLCASVCPHHHPSNHLCLKFIWCFTYVFKLILWEHYQLVFHTVCILSVKHVLSHANFASLKKNTKHIVMKSLFFFSSSIL